MEETKKEKQTDEGKLTPAEGMSPSPQESSWEGKLGMIKKKNVKMSMKRIAFRDGRPRFMPTRLGLNTNKWPYYDITMDDGEAAFTFPFYGPLTGGGANEVLAISALEKLSSEALFGGLEYEQFEVIVGANLSQDKLKDYHKLCLEIRKKMLQYVDEDELEGLFSATSNRMPGIFTNERAKYKG